MKIDFDPTLPLVVGSLAYAFWYWYYWCMKGKMPMPCIAIYPPPYECETAQGLPFYLPRPPFLPSPQECGFPCFGCAPPPTPCMANPMCVAGYVNNPLTCGCTPECQVVQQGSSIICPQGSRWNWCVKGCVPAASMMPDCLGPTCSA